jgi:serine/threonine protein kinase
MKHIKSAIGYRDINEYYNYGEKLGEGKFGKVYSGENKKTGEKVAIKVIEKGKKLNELDWQRREIESLKLFKHDYIIKMHDIYDSSSTVCIIMEFLEGDLFDYLKENNFNLPIERSRQVLYELALGIKCIHDKGVIHRDLKLENILMTKKNNLGIPKVSDFGLSAMIGPNQKINEFCGTIVRKLLLTFRPTLPLRLCHIKLLERVLMCGVLG